MKARLAIVCLLVAGLLAASCSDDEREPEQSGGPGSGGAPVATGTVDVISLSQRLDPVLQQSVSQGVTTQADKQQFMGNLRAGTGAIRVGYFDNASSGSFTMKTYPNETAVTADASGAQITRGTSQISLGDIRSRELLFVLVEPSTNRALNIKAYGVIAP
jgi:hypothetical protein